MKFENTEVFNFKGALRGMRNPKNSWDKSDSSFESNNIYIGENDMRLAKALIHGGSEHRKFLRQIIVSVDITAPLYWWKEFDTYKIGTVSNSCSTMHKLDARDLVIDDFSAESLDSLNPLLATINHINELRLKYLATSDKKYWRQMIQLLPSSYNQTRNVMIS